MRVEEAATSEVTQAELQILSTDQQKLWCLEMHRPPCPATRTEINPLL